MQMNLFTKQKQTHRQNKLTVTKGERVWGGINWEFGISIYTLLRIKQINKDLLYSTGNYIQYLVITYDGKESEYANAYIWNLKKKKVLMNLVAGQE